jgi:ribosomal-protein-alanine N-acetyltransferase
LELDVQYVEKLSLRLDAKIVLRTLRKLLRASDVTVIAGETGAPLNVERSYPRSHRIRLRRLARGDLLVRAEWMSHPATTRYTRIPEGITVDSTEAWFQTAVHDRDRMDFVAVDTSGDRIAMAGVKRLDDSGAGEFYIFVNPERAGEGIGGEVTRLVMEWAMGAAGYRRLTLEVHANNRAARRIYERLGWSPTGQADGRLSMAHGTET